MQKSENISRAHCTCMVGMDSTCNHIAAALFRVEAAMRLGLINPVCTKKTCEWLLNRKNVNFVLGLLPKLKWPREASLTFHSGKAL